MSSYVVWVHYRRRIEDTVGQYADPKFFDDLDVARLFAREANDDPTSVVPVGSFDVFISPPIVRR